LDLHGEPSAPPLELDDALEAALDAVVVEDELAAFDELIVVVPEDEEATTPDELAAVVVVKAPVPLELDAVAPPTPLLLDVVNIPVVLSRPLVENPHAPPIPKARDAARRGRQARLFSMPSIIAHVRVRQRQKTSARMGRDRRAPRERPRRRHILAP
jgi:hypothetical protein